MTDIRPAACPRCGAGPVVSYNAAVTPLQVWDDRALGGSAELGGGPDRPMPSGETKSQVRCESCGAHWPKVALFKQEWTAAGQPAR